MPEDSPSTIPTAQVLVVDDEAGHADVMAEALRRLGHVCTLVHDLSGAEDEIRHGQFDLIVTDLVMDTEDTGLQVLDLARTHQPDCETIMVTAHGDVPRAKAAIKGGAYDFIEKPLDLDVFRTLCTRAIQSVMQRHEIAGLRQRVESEMGIEGIIGQSPAMRKVVQTIQQVAPSNLPVLITGESGTGKELVANAIHNQSKRSKKRFVALNCAGLSETLLEDELFGHVRGAFTGADKDREGRFEYADGGTLFLDEIGDMPMNMQAKLLRVLESGEMSRVGSNAAKHVDVRFVSATNRDLTEKIDQSEFRGDLYYRIKGVEIHLPPLRERPEDIPLLVEAFVRRFAQQMDKPAPQISEDTMRALVQHDWPGNVRQVLNVCQNMVVVCDSEKLEPRHLPSEIQSTEGDAATGTSFEGAVSLDQLEKQAIRNALKLTSGNREQAAKMLGIGERTLYRKLKEYGLK